MDLDTSGNILLAGISGGSPTLATPGAQYTSAQYAVDGFLAQISADGQTLEYATYLDSDFSNASIYMRAGPGGTAYLALSCGYTVCSVGGPKVQAGYQQTPSNNLLLRYNIALKSVDQETYFDGGDLNGFEVTPSGALYLFRSTPTTALPLQNPIQSAPPTSGSSAGFIAAFSSDFRTLSFSSYLGGQNAGTAISSVVFNSDGSLWLSGIANEGSIPGLKPAIPFTQASSYAAFAVQVLPGASGFTKGFLAGGYGLEDSPNPVIGVTLSGGSYCLATYGPPSVEFPGGAALGNGGDISPILGCLNDAGDNLQMVTATGKLTKAKPR